MHDTGGAQATQAQGRLDHGLALVALSLFLLLPGSVEGGLLYWSWQALEGATIDAGRCAAFNVQSCGNPASSTAATQS